MRSFLHVFFSFALLLDCVSGFSIASAGCPSSSAAGRMAGAAAVWDGSNAKIFGYGSKRKPLKTTGFGLFFL